MDAELLAITVLLYFVSFGEAANALVEAVITKMTAIRKQNRLLLFLNICISSFTNRLFPFLSLGNNS